MLLQLKIIMVWIACGITVSDRKNDLQVIGLYT
jgi:hypothetical protein